MIRRRMADRRGDDVLVGRAAKRVAWQAAGLVSLALLLLVLLVTVALVRGQNKAADALLRTTVATADDVVDPPAGAWLVLAGRTEGSPAKASPGLPAELSGALRDLRAAATRRPVLTDVGDGDDGRSYRVATVARESRILQVVLDQTPAQQQRSRLLRAMGLASLLGLLFAGVLGVLLGRRAVRPLAEALALQRAFVADASHELRTPLTLLSTRAQLLDRAIQISDVHERVRVDARGVVTDVQRLGEVVDDLLVAADPRRDQPLEPVDLPTLVGEAVASAQAHAEHAGVRLQATGRAAPAAARGSATALRRAVLALVDNAIDHTPVGGEVTVQVRLDRRQIIVTVTDTGPGVAPAAAANVLRRFHSGGQRAGRAHYGLGLALSHDVANRHGGQLRMVEGTRGATFELVLPALPDADQN